METMTETGIEKRVDELSKRVDFGFEQVDRRVDELSKRVDVGFAQVDTRFGEMNERFVRVESDIRELRSDTKVGFDSLHQLMIRVFAGTIGSIIAGVVVLLLSHS
jgi:tetrahydromethanopterin S-methyltransferase subunit G